MSQTARRKRGRSNVRLAGRFDWLAPGMLVLFAAVGCGGREQLDACDIRFRSCQEDVFYAVARLRGDGLDPFIGVPPVRTITVDEYRAELEGDATPPPATSEEPKPPPKLRVNPWDRALQLLKLLTTEVTPTQASIDDNVINVAAFYSSGKGQVTVVDNGNPQEGIGPTATLVHELVHAFQDYDVGLGKQGGTDDIFVQRTLIEGEAKLYEELAVAEMQDLAPEVLDWGADYDARVAWSRSRLREERSPYFTVSRWFVYPMGGGLMFARWLEGGNAGVRKLWQVPPRTSVELMLREVVPEIPRSFDLDCEVEPPEGGFELAGYDRFGGIQLFGLLSAHGGEDDPSWDTALGWRDDRVWVFQDPETQEVALSYRIRFEDSAQAERAGAVLASDETLAVDVIDRDLRINAGEGDVLRDGWQGADACH